MARHVIQRHSVDSAMSLLPRPTVNCKGLI